MVPYPLGFTPSQQYISGFEPPPDAQRVRRHYLYGEGGISPHHAVKAWRSHSLILTKSQEKKYGGCYCVTTLRKVREKNIFFHSLFLLYDRWEQYDDRDNHTQGISFPRQEREYDNLPPPESCPENGCITGKLFMAGYNLYSFILKLKSGSFVHALQWKQRGSDGAGQQTPEK
jgi:hypothetical protein